MRNLWILRQAWSPKRPIPSFKLLISFPVHRPTLLWAFSGRWKLTTESLSGDSQIFWLSVGWFWPHMERSTLLSDAWTSASGGECCSSWATMLFTEAAAIGLLLLLLCFCIWQASWSSSNSGCYFKIVGFVLSSLNCYYF